MPENFSKILGGQSGARPHSSGGSTLPPPGSVIMATVEDSHGDGMYSLRWGGNRVMVSSRATLGQGETLILKSEISPEGKPVLVVQGPALPSVQEPIIHSLYGPAHRKPAADARPGEVAAATQPARSAGGAEPGTTLSPILEELPDVVESSHQLLAAAEEEVKASRPDRQASSAVRDEAGKAARSEKQAASGQADKGARPAGDPPAASGQAGAAAAPAQQRPGPGQEKVKAVEESGMSRRDAEAEAGDAPNPDRPDSGKGRPADEAQPRREGGVPAQPHKGDAAAAKAAATAELLDSLDAAQPASGTEKPRPAASAAQGGVDAAAEGEAAAPHRPDAGTGDARPLPHADAARAAKAAQAAALINSLFGRDAQTTGAASGQALIDPAVPGVPPEGAGKAPVSPNAATPQSLAETLAQIAKAAELPLGAGTANVDGGKAGAIPDAIADKAATILLNAAGLTPGPAALEAARALMRYNVQIDRQVIQTLMALGAGAADGDRAATLQAAARLASHDIPLAAPLAGGLADILARKASIGQLLQNTLQTLEPDALPAEIRPMVDTAGKLLTILTVDLERPDAALSLERFVSTLGREALGKAAALVENAAQTILENHPQLPKIDQALAAILTLLENDAAQAERAPAGSAGAPLDAGAPPPATGGQGSEAGSAATAPVPPSGMGTAQSGGAPAALAPEGTPPAVSPGGEAPPPAGPPPAAPQTRPAVGGETLNVVVDADGQPAGGTNQGQPNASASTATSEPAMRPGQPLPPPAAGQGNPAAPGYPPAQGPAAGPAQPIPSSAGQPPAPGQPAQSGQDAQSQPAVMVRNPSLPPEAAAVADPSRYEALDREAAARPASFEAVKGERELLREAAKLFADPATSSVMQKLGRIFQLPGVNSPDLEVLRPAGFLERFLAEQGGREAGETNRGAVGQTVEDLLSDDPRKMESALRELPDKNRPLLRAAAARLAEMEQGILKNEPALNRLSDAASSLRELGRQLIAVKAENLAGMNREPGVMLAEVPFKLADQGGDGRMQMFYRRSSAQKGGWTARVILDLNTTNMGPVLGDMRFFGQDMVLNMFVENADTAAFLAKEADRLSEALLAKGFRLKPKFLVLPPPQIKPESPPPVEPPDASAPAESTPAAPVAPRRLGRLDTKA